MSNEEQTSSNPETSDYFNDQATRYDARGSLYGRMKCWGSNSQNQLGDEGSSRYLDDSFSLSSLPFLSFGDVGATEPSDLVVLDMSLGENHTCALLSSRKANTSESGKYVRCFGSNQEQQLGNSSLTENVSGGDYDLDNTNPVQVVTGRRHTCVLKESGKVYCFGADDMGQSGVPRLQNTEDVSGTTYSTSLIIDFNPTQSERGGKAVHTGNGAVMFKQIASNASADHTCGITSQGNVFCWGANERGQCGTQPSWENLDLDTFALPLRSDASRHSDLRCNSTPSTSGFLNHNVKFPLKDTKNLKGTATQISVGGGFSCALVEASEGNTFLYKDGSKITINPTKYVTCWGDNTWGQLGVPNVDETPSDKNVITGDNLFQIMLPNGKVNQENKKIEYYNPFASTSLNCILDSQSDFCENNIGYNHDIASISTGKAHACITATNKNSNGGQNDVFCFGNNNKQQTVSSDVSFYGNESGHMGEDLKALELERYCKSNSAADVGSNADGEIEDHFAPLIKKIGDNSVCMISGTDLITQERGFSWPIFKTLNECEQDGRSCHPMILDANPNKVHFIPSFGIKNSISPAMDVENCPSGPVDGDFVSSNLEIANAEACVIHGTTLEPIPQNGYFWPLYGKSACESKHDTCVPKVFKEHPEEVFYTPLDQTVNSDVDISSLHACHLHGSSY